ncbi:hypothetical protein NEPAR05_2518, partial [Nematocida parisii]
MIGKENMLKKNNILIITLLITMIHHTCAFLDSLNTNRTHEIKLENNLVINPDGGLSPSTHYMSYLCKFMHNFRMYWHGVYREWYLKKKNNNSTESEYIGEYYKNSLEWKVHNNIDEDTEKNKYLQAFAQQLINMFPSEGIQLSIESEKSDSFTRFLREYKDKSDGLYVLASLFLLSEGINIPIKIVEDNKKNAGNKMLVLKKKETVSPEDKFHVNLILAIKSKTEEDNTAESAYQKKTEEIVSFFKSLATTNSSYCLKVPEEFSMPTTYEEFLKGNFLCNPKFLIQSYFFEYIDSVEMYREFVRAVYGLLREQISNKDEKRSENISMETGKKAQEVFDRLFIDEEVLKKQMKNITRNHYECFCELKENRDAWAGTPFINSELNCIYIPKYLRRESRFSVNINDRHEAQNSQDCILLYVFFYFAFDPETKIYNIDHLPNASKDLKNFFAKYSYPVESVGIIMQCEWCRVVSRPLELKDREIIDDSTISHGVLNMLYVMCDLVGNTPEIKSAINCIKGLLNTDVKNDYSGLKNCMLEVFSSLSRNKKVKLECNFIKYMKKYNEEVNEDIEVKLQVLYDFGQEWQGIQFETSNSYRNPPVETVKEENEDTDELCSIDSRSDDSFSEIVYTINNGYKFVDTYQKMIINQFIISSSSTNHTRYDLEYSFEKNKKKIVVNKCDTPNSLMLWGSLDSLEYKSHLAKQFLIHSSGALLNSNTPMVRFTSNLIGSAPLNDLRKRQHILSGCAYNENYKTYYPQLEYDVCTVPKTELSLAGLYPMIEVLVKMRGIKYFSVVHSCLSLLHVYKSDIEVLYAFSNVSVLINIIKEIQWSNNKKEEYTLQPSQSKKLNSDLSNNQGIACLYYKRANRPSIFDYVHQNMAEALPSHSKYNHNIIYICWLFRILESNWGFFKVHDIKPLYTHIDPSSLSDEFVDVLGDCLTPENARSVIKF